jgi:transcription termination factor Rho
LPDASTKSESEAVSADSIDLDGLERKDRSELAVIAQALGGKPTSRVKKADIITMILELAGVTPDADGGTDNAHDAGGESAGAQDAPDTSETGDSAGVTTQDQSEESGQQEPVATTSGSGRSSQSEQSEQGQRDQNPRGQASDSGSEPGPRPRREAASRSEATGGNESAGASASEPSPQGYSSSTSTEDDSQNPDGDPRRRRRRRGRDRQEEGTEGSQPWEGELVDVAGVLDLRDEGYGFLRVNGLLPSREDVYVSVKQTRQLGLRRGDWLTGASRPANRGEKNPALLRIDAVNGTDPELARDRVNFDDLTPVFPSEQLHLEREDHPYDMTSRIIDLIAPIGKGQRGLIVAPPKAGKTTVLQTVAQAIEQNHPEVELMVLLLDERPEEVTDMRRSIEGEVIASTFDRPAEEHTQVAELAIECAKRRVEQGQDVVILLDGITRLARAYNLAAPNGGRIMSGGLDTGALYPPKRFFGAARNIEEGGSLTILATALVDTNSKMDEVIFEEFKGTGNMELRLDRAAAERRIYPAIDVDGSSTRHEELLISAEKLAQVWKLRRLLSGLAASGEPAAGLELVVDRMRKFPTNDVFLAEIAKSSHIN